MSNHLASRWRVMHCFPPILIALIFCFGNVNAEGLSDQLHAAAKRGDARAVAQLLDEGADVDAPSKYKATALSFAAQHGHIEVVKVLLDHDATIDVTDTFYNLTPLYWAASKGHTRIAEALIDAGASETVGALTVACKRSRLETVAAILSKANLDENMSDQTF